MSEPLRATDPAPESHPELLVREQRIPPTRGLITAHNRRGKPLAPVDLQRWLRLSRHAFKTDKVDVLANGTAIACLDDLLPSAAAIDMRLSLRTDASEPPPDLKRLKDRGLLDIFIVPIHARLDTIEPWLRAASAAELPVRLQWQAPLPDTLDPEDTASRLAQHGVARVNLVVTDPFLNRIGCDTPDASRATIDAMQRLADALERRNVEANLVGLPFCFVDDSAWIRNQNEAQRKVDHAFYVPEAERLASQIFERGPLAAGKSLRILLSNATLRRQVADNWILPALLRHDYAYLFSRVFRRLTIHMRLLKGAPAEQPTSVYEKALIEESNRNAAATPEACTQCALNRICDTCTSDLRSALPGIDPVPVEGDPVVSALHFSAAQPKVYDPIDLERLHAEEGREDIVARAQEIMVNRTPDLLIGPHDYAVEDAHFDRMESGLKWWSVANVEKLSTVLGNFKPPLTISVDFGAGIADFVGFSLGRHCKLVCPMEGYRHNLTLHVDADGRYVLLRDKQPVRPAQFEGQYYLPLRLGERLQPRISAWNIDECIATQNIRVWTGAESSVADETVKYSIIIVSTRFTRRLHAVLRSLAHQRDFDLKTAEVIVCYVPGIDATDDLLDSVTLTYPDLRIVRSPFPERFTNSKGFLINETAKIARGEWIMLLDSDTLLPPDYFAKIEAVSDTAEFIAPDGRKLLPKDITARILMGEIDPWDRWDELVEGEGEFRHRETQGIPVGFCQTFRAKYLQMFPYLEVDHFETADMQFGGQLKHHLGEETRLSGTPVVHLDHGGSQWYGTQKHM